LNRKSVRYNNVGFPIPLLILIVIVANFYVFPTHCSHCQFHALQNFSKNYKFKHFWKIVLHKFICFNLEFWSVLVSKLILFFGIFMNDIKEENYKMHEFYCFDVYSVMIEIRITKSHDIFFYVTALS
jgi:hypothetical protein